MGIIKLSDNLLDRIFVIITAVAFAQFPQVIDHYISALTGAHYEAGKAVADIKKAASKGKKTIEQFIQKHEQNPDADFKASGMNMRSTLDRFNQYADSLKKLKEARPWTRWWVFLRNYDMDLLKAVKFKPGVPLNAEGILYAFFGLILGVLFYHFLIRFPIRKIFSKKKPSDN